MLNKDQKKRALSKVKVHKNDTGSSPAQIGLLTEKIKYLVKHLKVHKKDVHSRRGLLKMVQKRKRMLEYLKSQNEKLYKKVIKSLGIKSLDKKES